MVRLDNFAERPLQRTRILFEIAAEKLFINYLGRVCDANQACAARPEEPQFPSLIWETKLPIHYNSVPEFFHPSKDETRILFPEEAGVRRPFGKV